MNLKIVITVFLLKMSLSEGLTIYGDPKMVKPIPLKVQQGDFEILAIDHYEQKDWVLVCGKSTSKMLLKNK